MSTVLTGWAREFVAAPGRFGTLATVGPAGEPAQAVVWYALRDDGILLNSRVGRRWPANLLRDPRASLMVHDGYDYVLVRGRGLRLHEGAAAFEDIAALARVYHSHEPDRAERAIATFRTQERISFLLRPEAVSTHR
jgi:PPOX class probable F420-dependent enzyme